jgi:hypothetical protein
MRHLLSVATLLLSSIGQAGAQRAFVSDSVRRLPPSAFAQLPDGVRRDLAARACWIPQPSHARVSQNVVRGAFTAAGRREWAVICSVRDTSQILIYRSGPAHTARVVDSLARAADRHWVEEMADGQWGYGRLIRTLPPRLVRRWRADLDGHPIPQPIDHDALELVFIEKAAEAFYFAGGRWYRQLTAD